MNIKSIKYIIWLLPILGLTQALLQSPGDDFPFSTVIDILSENVEFSTFLRIIQKKGHVQYLNELQNFTLFAPVNSGFVKEDQITHPFEEHFNIEDYLMHDRVLEVRDLENGTYLEKRAKTAPLLLTKYEHRCFINEITVVEPDLQPSFQNASVQGIDNVLQTPPPINELLVQLDEETQDLKMFNDFMTSFSDYNAYTNTSTILVPLDANFQKYFNAIEMNYLSDRYKKLGKSNAISQGKWIADRNSLLQELIIDDIYGGILPNEIILRNKNDRSLSIESNSDGTLISVNNSDYSRISNRIFEIGVVHVFSGLDFLRKHIHFDAEKYLHGLNCSEFVKELYFRDLEELIQNGDRTTIFVPQASFNEDRGYTKPSILYHFVEDKINLEKDFSLLHKVQDLSTQIYDSAFCSSAKRLGGHCQKFKISRSNGGYYINGRFKILNTKPYEIGNTYIYSIEDDLKLPGDLVLSLPPQDHCSISLMLLKDLDLLNLPSNHKGYTILLPCVNSWDNNDLTVDYLKSNKTALDLLMKNLIFEELIYSNDYNVSAAVKNLYGNSVSIQVEEVVESRNLTKISVSNIKEDIFVERNSDIFFDQGVVHPINRLNFPVDLKITLKELIETTGTKEMFNYFEVFHDLSSIIRNNEEYSLLVPTASSIPLSGITVNSTDLRLFLELHLIPANETQNLLDCNGAITTKLGKQLNCRKDHLNNVFVSMQDDWSKEVRILKRGCTSGLKTSCVFLIDRPISLSWLDKEKYHLRLPGIAVGIGMIIGVTLTVSLLFCMIITRSGKAKDTDERGRADQATTPLVRPSPSLHNFSYSATALSQPTFEGSYSGNAIHRPRDIRKAGSEQSGNRSVSTS
ncbi:uncharacterized protein SKDI_12G0570 [Saccharomyces kudriavzevii IFO 1802]|uniref:YLR001C-like protein n=2 Tax=Saccharomyces kudriavzevii (strain ATCC MYA-4449 / AS 2.2408 / CBS 8840 / NBRC 1802 / NCYC 2889) TaxID=226230 RepID=J5RHD3_SACK1|nr:uncharacterized protein SKDI_12G0570 [Saccharomyces kudriavzevii IFO 1802]EJT41586.1 YLR001C-like protein [Saccharomyces kudriavzevii IFO 1802]CAI4045686.1 hypothetical protein SKDI_12G0570 [Saccharomyces kudriavzevii IFO 1802]